jgi:hypothetical protein
MVITNKMDLGRQNHQLQNQNQNPLYDGGVQNQLRPNQLRPNEFDREGVQVRLRKLSNRLIEKAPSHF